MAQPTPLVGLPNGMMTNPALAQDPNYIRQVLEMQRRARIADMLTQQGAAPIDPNSAGRISPTQGLAKLLQAYLGAKMGSQSLQDQASVMSQGARAQMGQNAGLAAALLGQQEPQPQQTTAGPSGPPGGAPGTMPPAGPTVPQQASATPGAGLDVQPDQMAVLMYRAQNGDVGAQEMLKAILAGRQPTGTMKEARDPLIGASTVKKSAMDAAGTDLGKLQLMLRSVPPGSPAALQIQDAIAKANYVPPAEVRAGNFALDASNKPIMYNPGMDKGVLPGPLVAGKDGVLAPSSASVTPGYPGAASSIEGAIQNAKTRNSVFSATGPGGEALTVWGSEIPGGSSPASGIAPPAPNTGRALTGGNASPQTPSRLPGLAGPSTTNAAVQKSSAEVLANAPNMIAQSKGAIVGLENALKLVEGGATTGPGTSHAVNALAVLNNLGIPIAKGDVDGYLTLQKYLQNSLNQAAQGTGATGSDARFESFMHGQPNADTMTAPALSGAIRYVLSQHDAAIARAQFIQQAYQRASQAGDPNAGITAQRQWADVANPRYFDIQRMAPSDQAAAVKNMSSSDALKFLNWRRDLGQR